MAKVLLSILFTSIILLGTTASAPSPSQLPLTPSSTAELLGSTLQSPPAPSSVAEPLGSILQTPPAPSSVAEPLGWTIYSPPAPPPAALIRGYTEREISAEIDVEANGLLSGLDGKQRAGVVLMVLGGSGLLVYGGSILAQKVRRGSSRRKRFGFLVQPRK